MPEHATSPEGSVIAPSHSASQVARRAAGYPDDYSDDGMMNHAPGMGNDRRDGNIANPPIVEEDETRGGSSDDEGMDSRKYQVHVNKPITPKQLAEQKAKERQAREAAERQQQNQNVPFIPQMYAAPITPAPTQQVAPRAAAPATLTNSAGAGGGLANGILRKRTSTVPAQAATAPNAAPNAATAGSNAGPVARNGRESNDERHKRFSTLGYGTVEPYTAPTAAPAIVLPSASQYTVEAHRKKNAPEATLVLPSSDARTSSYRAIVDSDEENYDAGQQQLQRRRTVSTPNGVGGAIRRNRTTNDGDNGSVSSSRKIRKGNRNSVYYDAKSDGGTSVLGDDRTERGGTKRSGHDKSLSEGGRSQGGFFGTVTGLFKKRDLGDRATPNASKNYGRDDDDTPPTSPKSKKGVSGGGVGGSLFGGQKKSRARKQDDSDSDAPDPKSLVRVVNKPSKVRPVSTAFSDMDAPRQPQRMSKIESGNVWVPPHQRPARKTMSEVGSVRRPPATATKRKSSVTSVTAMTPEAPIATGTMTGGTTAGSIKKKKVRPASSATLGASAGAYDPGALVANIAQNRIQAGGTTTFNPAQKYNQDTPSLMAAYAPPSQSALVDNMPLPSAKDPSRGIVSSATSPTLGTLPPPSPAVAAGQPLKKKKTVKRASTINGVPNGTLKASATAPNLAPATTPGVPRRSSMIGSHRPESILSATSAGTGLTERRKSVRLASNSKTVDATYENAGLPAKIENASAPAPAANGSANPGILKENSGNGGFAGEWGNRVGRNGDVSSDEEGDEYAKIRHQLGRTEKDFTSAGAAYKGKGRAY